MAHGIRIYLDTTAAVQQLPDALLARLVCHYIIDSLPNEALGELSENLGNMYRFYSRPAWALAESSGLTVRRVSARRGTVRDEPGFVIAPD